MVHPPDTSTAVFFVTLYWHGGGLAHFSRSVVGHIRRGSAKKTAQRVLGHSRIAGVNCDAPRRNRTYNLVIKSHLLCQLS